MSEQTKRMTEAELAEIELAAAEDRTTAGYATPRPWKWWTANSVRELRSEARDRHAVVAYGQRHPTDHVNDIAIDEGDMALITHAVNTLEDRCDTVEALVREVRRLRARDIEREAWALRLLADAGDPVARAVVNAPVVTGKPDPNEPPIDDLRPEGCVPHEVVLQRLLDRAAKEHEALTAEVARLREREAAWNRATRVDDPARVGERNVRLCSCDGADLPQIGDEIDACETCDGMVKATDDDAAIAPPAAASRAQWVSRAARSQPATERQPSREPNDAGGGP